MVGPSPKVGHLPIAGPPLFVIPTERSGGEDLESAGHFTRITSNNCEYILLNIRTNLPASAE